MSTYKAIQRDSAICSHCFRRVRHRFENNYAVDVVDGELWFREIDVADSLFRDPDESHRAPHEKPTGGLRTVCDCGRPIGVTSRPLSKIEFLTYGERLYERVVERGFEVDKVSFMAALEAEKSDPDNQFVDDELYESVIERFT